MNHLTDRPLLLRDLYKPSIRTYYVSERGLATQVTSALLLILFYIGDTLTDAIAFCFSYGGEDCEDQLRDSIPSHVTTEVNHVERDTSSLELSKNIQSIKR
ncbi:hypothetical protein MAE02_36930 [Microvirga aerophila]|uniref:Uncharacterized protein n=1 Tax=Microvirga aerophila TaxID=670291 RepID=A0A512BVX9_9HYPH|nr:hypothetical protein MAE02_36930 [Microvirga aerophila]